MYKVLQNKFLSLALSKAFFITKETFYVFWENSGYPLVENYTCTNFFEVLRCIKKLISSDIYSSRHILCMAINMY